MVLLISMKVECFLPMLQQYIVLMTKIYSLYGDDKDFNVYLKTNVFKNVKRAIPSI